MTPSHRSLGLIPLEESMSPVTCVACSVASGTLHGYLPVVLRNQHSTQACAVHLDGARQRGREDYTLLPHRADAGAARTCPCPSQNTYKEKLLIKKNGCNIRTSQFCRNATHYTSAMEASRKSIGEYHRPTFVSIVVEQHNASQPIKPCLAAVTMARPNRPSASRSVPTKGGPSPLTG